jgi:hypothetical protein
MCNPQFEHLMDEVDCINRAYGYVGVFDAIVYIDKWRDEYKGTRVLQELNEFMAAGARMFAPAEEVA